MTVVVRLPEDLHASVKQIAAIEGKPPAELVVEAWQHYLEDNKDRLAAELEEVAEMVRAGDTDALAEYASRSVAERAQAAADAARD